MNPDPDESPAEAVSRRRFLHTTALGAGAAAAGLGVASAAEPAPAAPEFRPFLTPDADFFDVSRGNPKPHTLTGEALVKARLTPESWRCEITADPFVERPHTKVAATLETPLTLDGGNALDLPALRELGQKHEVHFLKAMQCLNIDTPLGQGLWTGVPLREVLGLCGKMSNVRRVYYRGFHNDNPNQIFQSSVSYTQCFETAPGDLPVFLAYRLNGGPLSLERGGPVRMIVPWSHFYKSIKWLRQIFVTNDPRNNDTYAEGNNDPDSFLKTAAYVDKSLEGRKFPAGQAVHLTGQVIGGLSGVARVEFWVRRVEGEPPPLADDAPELLGAPWQPCELEEQPDWQTMLPDGVDPRRVLAFDSRRGVPLAWPPRYGMCSYFATVKDLKPGRYEARARSVDLNGYAQPEPRPLQKNGKNAIQVRRFEVVG
ncbi:MAG: molybdopterin-dependent oxidoreductase [Verrucomicrobiae bacterium]|nr:molybdopterin-dependent oxidoreductase [Verrucomicrobiae bacterium]